MNAHTTLHFRAPSAACARPVSARIFSIDARVRSGGANGADGSDGAASCRRLTLVVTLTRAARSI